MEFRDITIVTRRSRRKQLEAIPKLRKQLIFWRMDAPENVRLRCVGYRSERSRNGRRVLYHTGERNLSRLRGRMVAEEDAPDGNSMSKISSLSASPLGKPHLTDLIYLYIQVRKSGRECRCKWNGNPFWRAEIPAEKLWFVDDDRERVSPSFLQRRDSPQVLSCWNYCNLKSRIK